MKRVVISLFNVFFFIVPTLLIFKRLNILWFKPYSISFTRVMHINHAVGNRRQRRIMRYDNHCCLVTLTYLKMEALVFRYGSRAPCWLIAKQEFWILSQPHVRWKRVVVPHPIIALENYWCVQVRLPSRLPASWASYNFSSKFHIFLAVKFGTTF